MMRRLLTRIRRAVPALVLVAVAVAGGWLLFGRGGDEAPVYTVELDNAFGLTEGAEFRAAGVTVGSIKRLRVDRRTARALVDVEVRRDDFGDLRTDATCSIEPQSLIGEYFMDCEPGTSDERLPEGETLPVEQTTGTIPPDLVASVMRRPQREQLAIILSELGAGFATRGPELQQIIERAVPALRETDRVLKILGDNQRTIVALNRDASTVLSRLAANRRNVGRFVREARDTAQISAGRRRELAETIDRLPAFLRELRPTLAELGTVADKQTPALRDLRASAGRLTTLLERLGPFAKAADPAVDALGEASKLGTRAAEPATATLQRARKLGQTAKDPATNLRFVLEHIDNRENAVEPSPVSPGGRGFTGLEAFMRYPFVQSQALNLFDSRGYTLKLNALVNECSGYTNAETAKRDEARTRRCNAWLGPNQPGVTTSDPSATGDQRSASRDDDRRSERRRPAERRAPREPERREPPDAPAPQTPQTPQAPQAPVPPTPAPALPPAPQVDVQDLLDGLRETLPGGQRPAPDGASSDQAAAELLDYLLGS
jgi:ABC-type transporter Mla subunit MlaD